MRDFPTVWSDKGQEESTKQSWRREQETQEPPHAVVLPEELPLGLYITDLNSSDYNWVNRKESLNYICAPAFTLT